MFQLRGLEVNWFPSGVEDSDVQAMKGLKGMGIEEIRNPHMFVYLPCLYVDNFTEGHVQFASHGFWDGPRTKDFIWFCLKISYHKPQWISGIFTLKVACPIFGHPRD